MLQSSGGRQKIGGACAVVAPIVAFACILTAIASYPQFSWTDNALSDLGVVPGITMVIFNLGLIATGLLGLYFARYGLYDYLRRTLVGKVGAALFALTTVALMLIGGFNENYSPTHYIVSVAFFSLAPLSLFAITGAFWFGHQRKMAAFTVGIGIVAALPWILQFSIHYVPNVAIPETVSALAVSAWAIVVGYKILKEPRQIAKT